MVTINELQVENLKRVKAVKLVPSPNGLTVIGGKNRQGKTSVLDAIMWALGGDKYKPSDAKRANALTPPNIRLELSNGITVERKGVNSSLKVIDSSGEKSGQSLLNTFISKLALDLPSFINASEKEKADILLKIIGVGDKLKAMDEEENKIYVQRTEIGRLATKKEKVAEDMPFFPNLPTEPISALELIQKQQEILARNGENNKKRDNLKLIEQEKEKLTIYVEDLKQRLEDAENRLNICVNDVITARKTVEELRDESTAELEENLRQIDDKNAKIRSNAQKEAAEAEAEALNKEYGVLSDALAEIRKNRNELLNSVDLPLPGLTVQEGRLLYNNVHWDSMSGSDQLKVATAIVRKLNPECGFVLMDKLEQMDSDTLQEFAAWLEKENLQVIATRVSTGDECSIIIEDGMVKDSTEAIEDRPAYVKGVF